MRYLLIRLVWEENPCFVTLMGDESKVLRLAIKIASVGTWRKVDNKLSSDSGSK